MTSKNDILNSIRRYPLDQTPLPSLEANWITFADPASQFAEVLKFVGGEALLLESPEKLEATLAGLPIVGDSQKIACAVLGVSLGNVRWEEIEDPHQLADIDLAILPGEFAVAENAAVWVTDREMPLRAIYFLSQHVVLVVPRSQLVQNLHEAYERLSFTKPGYGLFISGPSKTADIEQSLVIGAHGPRSLTVVLT